MTNDTKASPREWSIKLDLSEPNRGWIYPTNHKLEESQNGQVIEYSAYEALEKNLDGWKLTCVRQVAQITALETCVRELEADLYKTQRDLFLEQRNPQKHCLDCGVKSLTGNVHDEKCFKWSNLIDQCKNLVAALKLEMQTIACKEIRENSKSALASYEAFKKDK